MTQPRCSGYVDNIRQSGYKIYHQANEHPDLFIPSPILEDILSHALIGVSLDYPLRTRAKVVKEQICEALGYPTPKSFRRTRPRFPAQNFDVYVQKSNNLQIWNEEVDLQRRYVIIKISANNTVSAVKVISGEMLCRWDTTGTLTQKYQARFVPGDSTTELISDYDTKQLLSVLSNHSLGYRIKETKSPIVPPSAVDLLPIGSIYSVLTDLIGISIPAIGLDQERNRGAELHRLVCDRLGYSDYADTGQFPDIVNQLLEIKLQTSPTIDLGLVSPDSQEKLQIPSIRGYAPAHCDVRYAIFYGDFTDLGTIDISHLIMCTGEQFFSRFRRFEGNVTNTKIQIPLPRGLFD